MLRGLYIAASGMLAQSAHHEAISNNLANISTVGFRGQTPSFRTYHEETLMRAGGADKEPTVIGTLGGGIQVDRNTTSFRQGAIVETGNKLDLALRGTGMFAVIGPGGEELFTRAGTFTRDAAGRLITQHGYGVLGANGAPIDIPAEGVTVSETGVIRAGRQEVGRLRVVRATDPNALDPVGEGFFRLNAAGGARVEDAPETRVQQGALEQANVDALGQMIAMIEAFRTYEGAQKALHAQDETLGRAINEIARA